MVSMLLLVAYTSQSLNGNKSIILGLIASLI